MSGNVALDVTIGLVFTYLLYSLYATVLMEIIASTLGLRARNLNFALKRMLMDEIDYKNEKKSETWLRIKTNMLQIFGLAANLEHDDLYKAFFNQPTVKYLNSGGLMARPSYMTADSFVKALIDSIKSNDQDLSLMASIDQGLTNWIQKPELENKSLDTFTHIRSLLHDSNGDLVKFKLLLEEWFNETMARSAGWYKRSTQLVLFIIGFFITVSFNVDTIEIVKKLSKDPKAREQMVAMAEKFNAEHPGNGGAEGFVNFSEEQLRKDIDDSQHLLSSAWTNKDSSKLGYVITHPGGYFLTILALSLGAPFWFDLLNKLVKLRSSTAIAAKPDTVETNDKSSAKQTLNRAG